MTGDLLRRIYNWLGLATFTAAALTFLRTTGLEVTLNVPGLSKLSPYGITVLALPLLVGMVLALHGALRAGAQSARSKQPVARVPVALVDAKYVRLATRFGRFYVWGFFTLFAVVPVLLLPLIYIKLIKGQVRVLGSDVPVTFSMLDHFVPAGRFDAALGWRGHYMLDSNVTYYPFATPYLYALAVLACVVSLALLVRDIWAPTQPSAPPAAGTKGRSRRQPAAVTATTRPAPRKNKRPEGRR